MVLITHTGKESAVDADEDQRFGNPLLLRKPLDAGIKVIAAHCASAGKGKDFDTRGKPKVENFKLLMRLMNQEKYKGLLFADISGLTQFNRLKGGKILKELLSRNDLHHRLVNGSDYPIPAINFLTQTRYLVWLGFITKKEARILREIYHYNPLLFDFLLKRALKHPETGVRFPDSVFLKNAALP